MWIHLAILLLVVCLGIIAFLRFNFTITRVHGDSMYPTLIEDDRLLTFNILPSLWLQSGQIVIGDLSQVELPPVETTFTAIEAWGEPFATEESTESLEGLYEPETVTTESEHSKIVKRIIGLPGDTVVISLSSLSANMQDLLRSRCDANGNLVWTVPKDYCFLRGDGSVSMDSLLLGCIPLSAITGIMLLKLPQ
jgi:signal peptidase I